MDIQFIETLGGWHHLVPAAQPTETPDIARLPETIENAAVLCQGAVLNLANVFCSIMTVV